MIRNGVWPIAMVLLAVVGQMQVVLYPSSLIYLSFWNMGVGMLGVMLMFNRDPLLVGFVKKMTMALIFLCMLLPLLFYGFF
ncbi:hypothetical protein [Allorhodopirellula solitaria]|uniref:Uncharacterized protein n=1 Tax=Allorhodopirellula solitaria TaxID=2527987 RepID=A0A5C5X1G6_9BACT|nr:hypothetical protein [Allorhodopirellula solitaria]TWT55995.1 hypothetical protein CA85_47030 [Allorhodopirellula solitaria]